ncbi:MAG: hypothetical protein PHC46_03600 [Clostridia bacterium]|nr:hypothetical protein [Clostridia bacterium]
MEIYNQVRGNKVDEIFINYQNDQYNADFNKKDRAIYHLYLLGIVKCCEVNYANHSFIIYKNEYNKENIVENLKNYIEKYDGNYLYKDEDSELDQQVRSLSRELLE